mmetsp:Transcript_96348/g.299545  ORF Transcript_96348/g.299545 Transcript_96348/m.299545 type:complete len:82 (-) Transcript_96348:2780-3025(-)
MPFAGVLHTSCYFHEISMEIPCGGVMHTSCLHDYASKLTNSTRRESPSRIASRSGLLNMPEVWATAIAYRPAVAAHGAKCL